MRPKTAIMILLLIAALGAAAVFGALYYKQKPIVDQVKQKQELRQTAIEKKKAGQELTEAEKTELDALIEEKVEEKREVIVEEAKDRPYSQDEVDFILSPKKTVEKELGTAGDQKSSGRHQSQEEIDKILGAGGSGSE